ncbi:hypothetical protein I4U23_004787 [Adineta vaga]|nr:hypothetical protein I4U23_004787 [Adineta vaga]
MLQKLEKTHSELKYSRVNNEQHENQFEATKQILSKSWCSPSFLFTKSKLFYTILFVFVIISGVMIVGIVGYKTNNTNDNEKIPVDDAVEKNDQHPQLRRGSSYNKAYEPEKLGHMNVYFRKSKERGDRQDLERYRFPVARYDRDRFPIRGPFLSFMPQVPLFVDRVTQQTIAIAATGVYILPPLINFFGRRFSVAELIVSGYASLVSSGIPPSGPINMMSYFQPVPLYGAGIPRIDPVGGGFIGGIRTKYKSFHIRSKPRKYVNIDSAYETEEGDNDDDDETYDKGSSYSEQDYRKRPLQHYRRPDTYRKRTKSTTRTMKTTTPAIPVADIEWGECAHPALLGTPAECGFLSVPLDYNHPKEKKIKIALSRIKHTVTDDKFQGIMLINPGGPGQSGLPLALLALGLPSEVSETYDFIGFDPRGVGRSEPAISCSSSPPSSSSEPAPEPVPSTQILEDIWLNASKTYAMICAKNNKEFLSHMTTVDIAKDMESIRLALRQNKINYYGFSAGTYLGQIYATLYPTRVRRMVLDSNLDPDKIWYSASLDSPIGIDRNIEIWFQWLAKYHKFYRLGDTKSEVRERWYNVRDQLKKNPINGIIGPLEWTALFYGVAYTQETWLSFGAAFSELVNKKDDTLILQELQNLINGQQGDSGDAFLFIVCTDAPWPRDWEKSRIEYWRIFSKAPIVTWNSAWQFSPCQFWSQKGHKPLDVNGEKIGDMLLVTQTLDPVVSLDYNLRVRELFPRSRLIAVENGTTHSSSLRGNPCVDNPIIAYLQSGQVPPREADNIADVKCSPLPEPSPTPLMAPKKKLKFRDYLCKQPHYRRSR